MFTIEQIQNAHSKVRSGADFPAYIRDLKEIGVTAYDTFVEDGHSVYFGANDTKLASPAKYPALSVADSADASQFQSDLKAHQSGKTDYPTFCNDAARAGIEKWGISMRDMTCTYFDKAGNRILVEEIPQ